MKVITLDGIDQCGKTTQINMLETYLTSQGYHVMVMHFPNYPSSIGKIISEYLKGHAVDISPQAIDMLYLADITSSAREIELYDTLDACDYLLIDRYMASNLAYGIARGSDRDWLSHMARYVYRPDVMIFLDITIEQRAKRLDGLKFDILECDTDLQSKIRANYLEVTVRKLNMDIIYAGTDVNTVHDDILQTLIKRGVLIESEDSAIKNVS